MNRRAFVRATIAPVAALGLSGCGIKSRVTAGAAAPPTADVLARTLPRWRGFNLLEKFNAETKGPFLERDFEMMADWGFDFVRLPLSYRCWGSAENLFEMREDELREIDQCVEFGRKHRVHVNINFHRTPGYCVNPPPEPVSLWADAIAVDASAHHWAAFAKRYRGIPSTEVSFDLLNEPAHVEEAIYARVMHALIDAVRAEDPARLIVVDGLPWGRGPVHSLAGARVGQSTRGYDPMVISHYQASWVGIETWPEPRWPLELAEGDVWDKERLRREIVLPWRALEEKGVGVHVGEWGAFNRTPHDVALAWMRDFLEIWEEMGWGWALWNFRGPFGVLESGRRDVAYEDFHGLKLDRRMLELLVAH
jgi:endoglucanase